MTLERTPGLPVGLTVTAVVTCAVPPSRSRSWLALLWLEGRACLPGRWPQCPSWHARACPTQSSLLSVPTSQPPFRGCPSPLRSTPCPSHLPQPSTPGGCWHLAGTATQPPDTTETKGNTPLSPPRSHTLCCTPVCSLPPAPPHASLSMACESHLQRLKCELCVLHGC